MTNRPSLPVNLVAIELFSRSLFIIGYYLIASIFMHTSSFYLLLKTVDKNLLVDMPEESIIH